MPALAPTERPDDWVEGTGEGDEVAVCRAEVGVTAVDPGVEVDEEVGIEVEIESTLNLALELELELVD